MTEKSMVCNGRKENKIENCISQRFLSIDKIKSESASTDNSKDTMTIGSVPLPKFDHLYASSVEDSEANSNTMNVARSCLNSCHLNLIEEQAKMIESQNQEIIKLKKQNESLIARIERMNRRLNLNQCSRRISIKYSNQATDENTFGKRNDQFLENTDCKYETHRDAGTSLRHIQKPTIDENRTANFRIRFRHKEAGLNEEHRKCNRMVRFVEAKRSNSSVAPDKSLKRNNAQAVDDKLKLENAVLFLKTSTKNKSTDEVVNDNHTGDSDSDETSLVKKKRMRFPIITAHEPFHIAVREDINCPVTYTPTALEVPSYRVTERDNIDPSEVPKNYCEDITVEAAKERHLRFEVGERKRKKWDVQRIREQRQNELLKEKLRRRKGRWNKPDSPKTMNIDGSEHISSLFPDIKNIEKIMITNVVPVTALGTSIAKIPTWGVDFHTPWINDGTVDAIQYEENEFPPHQQYHHQPRTTRSKIV